MADQPNDRDRSDENIGDEIDERDRQKKQEGASRGSSQSEPTDTLEDRNLSGSSTWANLPENQPKDEESDESEPGPSNK